MVRPISQTHFIPFCSAISLVVLPHYSPAALCHAEADLAAVYRKTLTDYTSLLNFCLFAFETAERLLKPCSWGMPHGGRISGTLNSLVISLVSQTMEILIRGISLDAGVIMMFAKPCIQCVQKITFTHLSKAQTLTYEAQKIMLVQCGIFKHSFIASDVWYHLRTPASSRLFFGQIVYFPTWYRNFFSSAIDTYICRAN